MEQKTEKTLTVAVVGHRDNGKSTFINSWLGHEYTEANEEDCTRGIHSFAISHGAGSSSDCREANLESIKAVNVAVKTSEIQEKGFDICLPEPLIQLHFGLKLVVKDYPGLDEDPQYQEAFKTGNHDLVIVLVDSSIANRCDAPGASGSQRALLDLVKESIDVNDDDSPPLIILVNKVDDQMDKDTKKRVEKVNTSIAEVFTSPDGAKLSDRDKSAEGALTEYNSSTDIRKHKPGTFPIVIKMSAKRAFNYRKMSALSLAEIGDLDMEDLESYAIDGCGRSTVQSMSKDQLVAKIHGVSRHDSSEYVSNLESTGFPKVLAAIESCISGPNRQGHIIGQQLRRSQSSIVVFVYGGYTARVLENLEEQKTFSTVVEGEPNFTQYKKFHDTHRKLVKKTFSEDPRRSSTLVKCFEELLAFKDDVAQLLSVKEDGKPNKELATAINIWIDESIVGLLEAHLDIVENGVNGKNPSGKWDDKLLIDSFAWNLEVLKEAMDDPILRKLLPDKKKGIVQLCSTMGSSGASKPSEDFKWKELPLLIQEFWQRKEAADLQLKIDEGTKRHVGGFFKELKGEITKHLREISKEQIEMQKDQLTGMKRSLDEFLASDQLTQIAKSIEEAVDVSKGSDEEAVVVVVSDGASMSESARGFGS